MQAEILVPVCEVGEAAAAPRQLADFPHGVVVAPTDGVLIRCQPLIVRYQSDMFCFSHVSSPLPEIQLKLTQFYTYIFALTSVSSFYFAKFKINLLDWSLLMMTV